MCIRDSNYTEAATSFGSLSVASGQLFGYNVEGTNNYGFSAYWQPEQAGWLPSISAGVGASQFNGSNSSDDTWSWMVGLQWADAVIKGNAFGIGLGENNTDLNQFGLEVWYKFQVTDNISVTPAIFWIENGGANNINFTNVSNEDSFGAVLKTTFKF